MSVREKAAAIFASTIVFMVVYAWVFDPFAQAHLPPSARIFLPFLWIVVGNLYIFGLARFIRCPHCGARFGWSNYVQHGRAQPWPYRKCPNCGENVYEKAKS